MAYDDYSGIPVVGVDGTANVRIEDVIGNRSDTHNVDTLSGQLHTLDEHAHMSEEVYPTLADPVTLTASTSVWTTFGDWVEIVPEDTITDDFDIHFVDVSTISAAGSYEIQLGAGAAAAESEITHFSFTRPAGNLTGAQVVVQTPIQTASTRISARIASGNAAANTADVKIHYHTY